MDIILHKHYVRTRDSQNQFESERRRKRDVGKGGVQGVTQSLWEKHPIVIHGNS